MFYYFLYIIHAFTQCCHFDRTHFDALIATHTPILVNLWIFKPFVIFYHRDGFLGANRIASCTSTTFFFSGKKHWLLFFCCTLHKSHSPQYFFGDFFEFPDSPPPQRGIYSFLHSLLKSDIWKQFKEYIPIGVHLCRLS